jgi:hypothetical protein
MTHQRLADTVRLVLGERPALAGMAARFARRSRRGDGTLWGLAALAVLVVLALPVRSARAEVARYAVVLGNNQGDRDEAMLRYAERDAERFSGVLLDVGGFPAHNVVTLLASDADTARATLIAINDRIRNEHAGAAMLVVYYSGHADAAALHLGRTALPITQLEQLVRGSSASFRLLAVDACRSGVLTRVKGGRLAPPIPIVLDEAMVADGVVFWTASAEREDAQESDDVQGSFFTHYLVSGLAGPADVNGDGAVTTDEAFEYARAATLRASSRTLAGPQHATFRDEVRGRQDIVLTTPGAAARMAAIELPRGRDAIVMAESETGRIVGEIAATDRGRRLTVRPGRYFLRERADGYLLEGTLAVTAGAPRLIRDDELARIAYASLVRKGGRGRQDAVAFAIVGRTAVLDGGGLCAGARVGYAIALPWITITPALAMCRERMANPFISTTLIELAASATAAHVWDVGRLGLGAGLRVGGSLLHERFSTTGDAPPRSEAALTFALTARASLQVTSRLELAVDAELASYLFRQAQMRGQVRWATPLALGGGFGLAYAW